MQVANYAWPIYVEKSPDLNIGWVQVETYVKALHLEDVPHCRIGGGRVYGASPNAQYLPGHNGILMESNSPNDDIRIGNFLVENSAEHGYRISGPAKHTNIWLQNCMARNVGGTGFKVLGRTLTAGIYNEGITFDNCRLRTLAKSTRTPAGSSSSSAITSASSIRSYGNGTDLLSDRGHPALWRRHVTISDPKITDTFNFGLHLDAAFGNIADVKVNGLHIEATRGHSVYLQNPGVNFRDNHPAGGVRQFFHHRNRLLLF